MLETFYKTFGFIPALLISFVLFMLFIFWMAGVAGICRQKKDDQSEMNIILAVFIPVYPIIWLISEMVRERKLLKRTH
jgi:integral membrane sensor domain MASE1